jgi:hypothetical protein
MDEHGPMDECMDDRWIKEAQRWETPEMQKCLWMSMGPWMNEWMNIWMIDG